MKENFDSLFDPAIIRDTIAFYETRDRWQEILNYRKLTAETGHVDNLFYGDSITDIWPLHEFFPNHSLLNRGIGGDNVHRPARPPAAECRWRSSGRSCGFRAGRRGRRCG